MDNGSFTSRRLIRVLTRSIDDYASQKPLLRIFTKELQVKTLMSSRYQLIPPQANLSKVQVPLKPAKLPLLAADTREISTRDNTAVNSRITTLANKIQECTWTFSPTELAVEISNNNSTI